MSERTRIASWLCGETQPASIGNSASSAPTTASRRTRIIGRTRCGRGLDGRPHDALVEGAIALGDLAAEERVLRSNGGCLDGVPVSWAQRLDCLRKEDSLFAGDVPFIAGEIFLDDAFE